MVHEDQVISVVAGSLRSRGVAVLAEGGNQMRCFRFRLASGRRKAPDLVFVASEILFVFEAKVLSSDLVRPASDGVSDVGAMLEVAGSELTQREFLLEAADRLRACGRGGESVKSVASGILASGSVLKHLPGSAPLEVICVDLSQRSWIVEQTQFGTLLPGLAR